MVQVPLADETVYTIATPERLVASADDANEMFERKRWTSAAKIHCSAKMREQNVPIVFADARDCSQLIAWSVLLDVTIEETGTRYRIGPLLSVPRSRPQDLQLLSTGKRIAEGFIRPYALCRTPRFLQGARTPWRSPDAELRVREGQRRLTEHLTRERSTAVVSALKDACLKQYGGRLPCEVCGFDFVSVYGKLGHRYAEAHHREPLSRSPSDGRETTIADLAIVCSNCHRMLHVGPEFVSIEQLRAIVRNNSRTKGQRANMALHPSAERGRFAPSAGRR